MLKTGLIILGLLTSVISPQENASESHTNIERNSFKQGEKLTYSMRYGIIHGGDASLTLRKTKLNNKTVYHARAYARSVGITDKLFRVEDIYESYFDPETGLPLKSIRNISEGGYKFYNEVEFVHADSSAYSQKSGHVTVPSDILDMVSTLYYLRNMDLDNMKKGERIEIITFFGDEIFPFPLRYRGKENVKTRLGEFKCHRFDPVVEVGRIFESEDDMTIWISADKNKVPIRVRFDMIVGGVLCDLSDYKNLSYPLERLD